LHKNFFTCKLENNVKDGPEFPYSGPSLRKFDLKPKPHGEPFPPNIPKNLENMFPVKHFIQ